ncbi:BRCA1-A complex subunit RAP80 isoform X2 [Rhinoderma darwinii]
MAYASYTHSQPNKTCSLVHVSSTTLPAAFPTGRSIASPFPKSSAIFLRVATGNRAHHTQRKERIHALTTESRPLLSRDFHSPPQLSQDFHSPPQLSRDSNTSSLSFLQKNKALLARARGVFYDKSTVSDNSVFVVLSTVINIEQPETAICDCSNQVLMTMYHRRKQRFSEGTCRQYGIDNESSVTEPSINVDPENRTDNEDLSIVISDSDDKEPQEESTLPKKRYRPPSQRKPLQLKRKIAHMTEEEQLALAVKISQQEQTKPETFTQEEEDELIKKAIEESLHNGQVPDTPVSATTDKLTDETPSSKEFFSLNVCKEEPCLLLKGEGSAKSPVVLLQRLSQDIVESSSVILSPNCKDPISCIENCRSPPSPCNSSDFVKMSPFKEVALSPVFPKKLPCSRRLLPSRLFQAKSQSADMLVDELDDQCSHCSDSSQVDSPSVLPPLCFQGDSSRKKIDCEDNASVDGAQNSDGRSDNVNQSGGTVHYYWGVPFCPKRVDPGQYTKVILCQLEVYQKSLKSAQRKLLHKMDYGQPIHLAASSQENVKEDTQGSSSQEDTEERIAEDDTHKPEGGEREHDEDSDPIDTQHVSHKRQKMSPSPAQAVLENDHRPSSQGDKEKTLFTKLMPRECAGVAPVAPGESAVPPTAARNDRHLMEHTEIAQEDEITICPETQPSPAMQEESDKADQPDVMEIAPEPQACLSTETSDEDIICLDKMFSKNVACPMCGSNFPRTQIERHAAYCDGSSGQKEMAVLRPRNKPMRRSHNRSAVSGK